MSETLLGTTACKSAFLYLTVRLASRGQQELTPALVEDFREPLAFLLVPLAFHVLYGAHFLVPLPLLRVEHHCYDRAVGQEVNQDLGVLVNELVHQPGVRGLHLTVVSAVVEV